MLVNIHHNHFLFTPDPYMTLLMILLLLNTQVQQKVTSHISLRIQIRWLILVISKWCLFFNNFHLELTAKMVNKINGVTERRINLYPVLPIVLLPKVSEFIIADIRRIDQVQYLLSHFRGHHIPHSLSSNVLVGQIPCDIHRILRCYFQSLVLSNSSVLSYQYVLNGI